MSTFQIMEVQEENHGGVGRNSRRKVYNWTIWVAWYCSKRRVKKQWRCDCRKKESKLKKPLKLKLNWNKNGGFEKCGEGQEILDGIVHHCLGCSSSGKVPIF